MARLFGQVVHGDIFIVALIIVLVKAEGFAHKFTAEPGVFCYAGSAILASIAASMVKWTAGVSPKQTA